MKTLLRFGRVVSRKDGHTFQATFQPSLYIIAGDLCYSCYPYYYYKNIGNSWIRKALYRSKRRTLYGAHTTYDLHRMDWRANSPYKIRIEAYA